MAREYEGLAQALASRGRYGDSMLMHVNPEEVNLLNNLAPGGITVNPDTGLPEAFELFSLASLLSALLGPTLGTSLAGGITSVFSTIGTTLGIGGGATATAAPTVAAATIPTGLVATGAPALGVGAGALPMGFGVGGTSMAAGLPAIPGAAAAIPGSAGVLSGIPVGFGAGGSSLAAGVAPSSLVSGAAAGAAPAAAPAAASGLPSAVPGLGTTVTPPSGFGPGGASVTEGAGALTLEQAPGWLETGAKIWGEVAPKAMLAGLGATMLQGDDYGDDEEGGELSDEEIASRGEFEDFTPPGPPVGSDIVGSPTDEAFETFVSDSSMMPGAAGVEDIGTLASATMAPPPSGIGGEQIADIGVEQLYMDYMNSGSPLTFDEWIQMEGGAA